MGGAQDEGDLFTFRLQAKILEEHGRLLVLVRKQRDEAISIAEALRDWLAYEHNESDPKLGELNDQLQKLRGE